MSTFSTVLIFLMFMSNGFVFSETNYYWRYYTGKIPSDAIVGGKNINGDNVYIGQAYLRNKGLMPVQINAGETYVYVEFGGPHRVKDYFKILCGPSENFAWIRSNNTRLHLDLLNKNPVVGGHADDFGIWRIGRIFHDGGTRIARIDAFVVGNAVLWFVDKNDKMTSSQSYEVLIYEEKVPL